MTTKLYFTGGGLTAQATITRVETGEGVTLFLDRTIFHPQGGGQKSDAGMISGVRVLAVKKFEGDEVAHVVAPQAGARFNAGDVVELSVDAPARLLHSRLHTAGHLIAAVGEELMPQAKATAGHHWPKEARVEFAFTGDRVDEGLAQALGERLAATIQKDLPVAMTDGVSSPRVVTIGEYAPLPCGGTHVPSLRPIGAVTIRNIQLKKGVLKIGYDVA